MSSEIVPERLSTKNVFLGKKNTIFEIFIQKIIVILQFSDMLLYANRAAGPGLQFRVHGQLTVSDLQVRRKKYK